MSHTSPEKLLTKEMIAELLGMKPKTVGAWYRRKKIPGVKVGGKAVRFYWSEVSAVMVKRGIKS
ncbi:MAG: helix-turn-helix domain-containing protein [Verrucomicrobiota bacterium]